MCGIAGYVRPAGLVDAGLLGRMAEALRHRGPDGRHAWTDARAGVAMTHTRLMVQDLTAAAEQPMTAPDGSALVYNGEIYNFRALRDELIADGATFTSTGDTAVLFELCRRDPALGFLPRLNGMFAFAYWHGPTRVLSLVRDRTGVKPLLLAALPGGGVAFASEMGGLRPMLDDPAIDADAVRHILTLGFIAAPRTIFRGVTKLPPGQRARCTQGHLTFDVWAPRPGDTAADERTETGFCGAEAPPEDFEAAKRVVRTRLGEAVRLRLLADVPVGVFLSGGIDSAIVTALAAKHAQGPVRTFSVGFPGESFYDESRYANAVAKMHGTDHTSLALSLTEIREAIPTVFAHLGEPFADSSVLPTYLLSRLTRAHVTVALSGDGADELFAGYNRYAAATLMERYGWFARSPAYRPVRRLIEMLPGRRETWLGGKASMLKRAIRSMDPCAKRRYAYWMRTSDDATFTRLMHDPRNAARALEDVASLLWAHRGEPKASTDLNNHLQTEWRLSLPDDMLTKVDLASMAHGLEVRSPFLDCGLVDAVMPMNWRWKLNGYRKKHLLIEAFKDELPPALHDRPKKGFEVPVGVWLRGPLHGMARDLIENDRCFFGTVLSREGARATLEAHRSGRQDHNFCLWALVSLLAWQQKPENVALQIAPGAA